MLIGESLDAQLKYARETIKLHIANFADANRVLDEVFLVQEHALNGRAKAAWIETREGNEAVLCVRGIAVSVLPCPQESRST